MTTKITNDNITSMDASKLTGSLPGGMAPETDLSSVKADILKLALHQAIDGNRVAYNLEDSFVDGFEDDSGITTETTVDRDTTGEYVNTSTIGTPAYVTGDRSSTITPTINGVAFGSGNIGNMINGTKTSFSNYFTSQSVATSWYIRFQFSTAQKITEARWWNDEDNDPAQGTWQWQGSNDATTWTDIGSTFQIDNQSLAGSPPSYQTLNTLSGNTSTYTYYQMKGVSGSTTTASNHLEIEFKQAGATVNATGTLISDPQTASTSRTSCSGVIIYEDADGANTLGTDLKIYFTANNGTNWTEAASYGTATTYSGTKKLVKLGATTVTAGSAIAMKAVWANQSSGAQSQIAQGTGTAIGNAVSNGGLSSAFDANTNQAGSSSATISAGSGNDTIYVGKDWGSGVTKTISGFKVYSTNNDGISSSGASGSSGCSLTLFGSNSNDISSATNLGGLTSLSFRTNSTTYTKISGLTTTTAYRYHWVKGVSNGHSGSLYFAEVEFYETSTAKEARLHGWAVNY